MTSTKDVLAFSGESRAARRLPIVTAQFREKQKSATGPARFANILARLSAADLIKFAVEHFDPPRRFSAPACRTTLFVRTPSGAPAATIYGRGNERFRRWQLGNDQAAALADLPPSVSRSM
jgi:hypothetical protein